MNFSRLLKTIISAKQARDSDLQSNVIDVVTPADFSQTLEMKTEDSTSVEASLQRKDSNDLERI